MSECGHTTLEGIKGGGHGYVCRQSVPLDYCSWKVTLLDELFGLCWDEVGFRVVMSGSSSNWSEVLGVIYGNQVVDYFVEEDEADVSSPLFQATPLQVLEHGSNTGFSAVVVTGITGCSPLNHLQLLLVFLSVGVPYCRCIFQLRSDKGFIGISFDMLL